MEGNLNNLINPDNFLVQEPDHNKRCQSNEPTSTLTHAIGTVLSVYALIILIIAAAQDASAWHVVSFAIFGCSLIALYGASTIYHIIPCSWNKAKALWKDLDRSMIYVLIAGTYTPVTLTVLRGAWGWALFGVVWGLAALGIILQACRIRLYKWIPPVFYIIMGWLALIAIAPLMQALPSPAIFWLVLGGVFYTVGTIFFGLDDIVPRTRWFGMHEIFHVFVILGSASHVWLMWTYILNLP